MSCKVQWPRKFLADNLEKTWINKAYKVYRELVLFERELGMMPATQVYVEREIQVERFQQEMNEIDNQIEKLRIQKFHVEDKMRNVMFGHLGQVESEVVRKEFIRQCPNGECRGFLTSSLKCNICEHWACGDCREVKGNTKNAEHTCNKEILESVKMLEKDTKPCPKCSSMIFKIIGCFAKDTEILMYDGSIKMVQDIEVDDVLVGDDGKQRIVKSMMNGDDEMYEIQQSNGENYTVNSKHKLVLKYSGDKSVVWHESNSRWKVTWFCRDTNAKKTKDFIVKEGISREEAKVSADTFKGTLLFPEEIEIVVEDYLKLDKWVKKGLVGYKSSDGVKWDAQEINLDPYLLGYWLGDGTTGVPIIASEDVDVQKYVLNWCERNDAELVHDEGVKFRIRRKGLSNGKDEDRLSICHGSTSDTCKGCRSRKMDICDMLDIESSNEVDLTRTNPFTCHLKHYDLMTEKKIPKQYLLNSREVRLQLLAGIIDSDGHVSNNGKRVCIKSSDKKLAEQIEFLCRSLGFIVNVRVTERKNMKIFNAEPKDYKDQYSINLSGEFLGEIPTIIPRKLCQGTVSNKDYLRTAINVVSKGVAHYYGFSVGDNKRFVSPDFTVYRNCDQMWCTQCQTPFSWKTGRIETGTIHNPEYFSYLRRTGGGAIPRTPGDIQCGRELDHHFISQSAFSREMMEIVRNVIHIQRVEMRRFYTEYRGDLAARQLRINYMRQKIDKDQLKVLIQKREKDSQKKREVYNVLTMYTQCMTDILYRLRDNPSLQTQIKTEMRTLKTYTNECFENISKSYSCKKWGLNDKFVFN